MTDDSKRSHDSTPLKIVFHGDGGIGKTSLLIRFVTDSFPTDYIPAVFDNEGNYSFIVDGNREVTLSLWDAGPGGEDFWKLRPLCFAHTDVFLVCFDISCRGSFDRVSKEWVPEITTPRSWLEPDYQDWLDSPFIIVGTKIDLRKKWEVDITQEEGKAKAQELGAADYLECSALTGEGLRELFEAAVHVAEMHRNINDSNSNQGRCAVM